MQKTAILADLNTGRQNNFDFIRFMAATLVILSHAYPLTGNNSSEPLIVLTNYKTTFGGIAVYIFFVTSGFLITQSYTRSKDRYSYLKARVLRIFPALLVVILATAFLLGPMTTSTNLMNYFTNPITYSYIKNNILLFTQYQLPGVFENNPYPGAVNGSLWTLMHEFLFYLLVAAFGQLKLLTKKAIIVVFGLTIFLSFTDIHSALLKQNISLFRYFSAGMLFFVFKEQIPIKGYLAFLSLFAIILSNIFGGFEIVLLFFGSYLLFYCVFTTKMNLHNFGKHGDFSYGIYIYAFPIQQFIMSKFVDMNPMSNFLIAFPLTLILACFSWNFIEKPSLEFKKKRIFKLL